MTGTDIHTYILSKLKGNYLYFSEKRAAKTCKKWVLTQYVQ